MMSILHMLATLVLVGALSGGGLALVFRWAEPLILENERRETLAAVNAVVPGGTGSTPLAELLPGGDAPLPEAFRVEDAAGAPLGWALVGTGTGFQDKIRLMVGLSADLSETRGLKVLKDNETPGLGTKIRDGEFPAQFSVPGEGPRELGGGLRSVKGPAGSRREVSAITGATISSVAVVEIVNASVAGLRPRLEAAGLLESSQGEKP
jgi:Na+-translocating ferredoxin:NAD+ oxidoreductase subunit G